MAFRKKGLEWRAHTLLLEDISQTLVIRECGQDDIKATTKVVPLTTCKLATKYRHGHAVLVLQDPVRIEGHFRFLTQAQVTLTTFKFRFDASGDLAQWLTQFDRSLQFLQDAKTRNVCTLGWTACLLCEGSPKRRTL